MVADCMEIFVRSNGPDKMDQREVLRVTSQPDNMATSQIPEVSLYHICMEWKSYR